ncbi:alpha-glucosidase [Pseudoroseicyclus aestuarii]|uniref:Alpha-glucosidase n=1 Tax=Pseudoroseicyclus aestuarii TaxID=1795041 RepID=A0A318SUD0_9RHOB|nr:alpha-glucosidase [Pseudoroseicyclus aestuarii]PYE82410.1 alpha-glucosidase [Pseudoroseicyclus aestuarii]
MSNADWWRGSVTYQIYPRSFQDSSGDGIGDLKGITSRLGHIADLGVDAIWLSPIFTSPMADMGYDVADYTGIDPSFGTMEDFEAMVTEAHRLGLKVIIDQVLSHSSNQHPFFEQSRQSKDNDKSDWYVWADPKMDGSAPNNWQAIFGGIAWEWEPRRKQYYFHNFLKEQPDWNFHNPEVQDWLLGTMKFWLDKGVDGFRLDTVNFYFHDQHLRDDPADFRKGVWPAVKPYDMQYHLFSKNQPENLVFLGKMRALLDQYDARTLIGEVGESHHAIEIMGEYTSANRLHMAYSFEMLSPNFTPGHFRSQIDKFFSLAPEGWPCWAMSNHDVIRHVTRFAEHGASQDAIAKLSAAMLLSFEGSVCIYQGEEVGQTETDIEFHELTDPEGMTFWPEAKGRDGCRTPMVWEADAPYGGFSEVKPWLPVKAPQLSRAVDTQQGVEGSVLETYRALLKVRGTTPELRTGRTEFLKAQQPVLGFIRGGAVLCVFNLSNEATEAEIPATGDVLFQMESSVDGGKVTLGPNGALIARLA